MIAVVKTGSWNRFYMADETAVIVRSGKLLTP